MIWVTPLSKLDETIQRTNAQHVLSLSSMGGEPSKPARIALNRYLALSMHDVSEPCEGLVAPSVDHVSQIIRFGRFWNGAGALVIHCYAGISRSTAAAYAISAALNPELDEVELAQRLRRLSPSATPNALIVAHADNLLGRQGRMVRAIAAIGRGEEAFEGKPFEIKVL